MSCLVQYRHNSIYLLLWVPGNRRLLRRAKFIIYLQWTFSLHLSSNALSCITGFSARQVKYFPSSSITGIKESMLKPSPFCSVYWKNKAKILLKNSPAKLGTDGNKMRSLQEGESEKEKKMAHEISKPKIKLRIFYLHFSRFVWFVCFLSTMW